MQLKNQVMKKLHDKYFTEYCVQPNLPSKIAPPVVTGSIGLVELRKRFQIAQVTGSLPLKITLDLELRDFQYQKWLYLTLPLQNLIFLPFQGSI